MHIESLRARAWHWALLGAVGLLSACPGELRHKADFEAYEAARGDAGAPGTSNEAGADSGAATAGSAGNAGSSSGSSGSSSDSAGSSGSDACGDVRARILEPSCGGTGRHGATAPQQDLDLISEGIASRVVGVMAKQCLQVLADPENPEQSLLYTKLLARTDCGAQMPLARPPLSSADIECVRVWIAAGAN
jgi:hypothetical protein